MNELNSLINEWGALQAGVDKAIYERFKIQDPRDLIPGLLLALRVEIGELANETRCFKHWSAKEPAEAAVILEEFADNMAFVFSIGCITGQLIDIGQRLYFWRYEPYKEEHAHLHKKALIEQFNWVFKEVDYFEESGLSYGSYIKLLQALLNLAAVLGFSLQDIDAAYRNKTAINHKRQEDGY